jgi:hypothetical protein
MENERPITYESNMLDGRQRRWPTYEKELFAEVHCLKTWQHYLGLHKTKVYINNAFVEVFWDPSAYEHKAIAVAWCMVLMNVDLIHKPERNYVVLDALCRQEELQGMNKTQSCS